MRAPLIAALLAAPTLSLSTSPSTTIPASSLSFTSPTTIPAGSLSFTSPTTITAGSLSLTSPTTIPASSPSITWGGRTLVQADGSVAFDWEGVSATLTVANSTYVSAIIADSSDSGTRFSTTQVTAASGTTGGQNLHVLDFLTSPGAFPYTISRGQGGGEAITLRLTNEIEPCFTGVSVQHNFSVLSFTTDGVFVPNPAPPTARRFEFIGDSITAGMGARFAGPCGANSLQNAFSDTYTDLICKNVSAAACITTAWSGIGVLCNYGPDCNYAAEFSHAMPHTYNYALGGGRDDTTGEYLWDFSRFTPDGLMINLGTNDWSGGRDSNATFQADYVAAYTTFALNITRTIYKNPSLPLFLVMGPLSLAPSAAVQKVVANVNAAGGNATFIELGTPGLPIGCAGHPSPAMHAQMAAIAIPVVRAVLGWTD
jgi:hypothetical protein